MFNQCCSLNQTCGALSPNFQSVCVPPPAPLSDFSSEVRQTMGERTHHVPAPLLKASMAPCSRSFLSFHPSEVCSGRDLNKKQHDDVEALYYSSEGRFVDMELIGKGAFGSVLKATSLALRRKVAVKRITNISNTHWKVKIFAFFEFIR